MSLINCGTAYQIDIPGCIETITIDAPTESTDYKCVFGMPNGFKVSTIITSDAEGTLTFQKDGIIEGFWNDGIGPVTLQIFEDNNCTPSVFTICTKTYSLITLNFIAIQTDDTTINITCDCQ